MATVDVMRQKFHDDLDDLVLRLGELISVVGQAMRRATVALLDANGELADSVVVDDVEIAARQHDVDELALGILARQQPVATDLRTVVACLRMSVDLRRMGKLAVHIAEITRRRLPGATVPTGLVAVVLAMADVAERLVGAAGRAVEARDGTAAAELEHQDDEVDLLQEQLYGLLFTQPQVLDTENVADIALIGRYYERFADHAVSLARDVAYLAGTRPLDAAAR